jgi:hypothetical protein
MFNNSKVVKLALLAISATVLASCGGGATSSAAVSSKAASSSAAASSAAVVSSVESDPVFSQNTASVAETMYNLQIVGSGYAWTPAATNPHFVHVSKMLWTLSNITVAADEEFKFTFDDTWKSDFGWVSVYNTGVTPITDGSLVAADAAKVPANGEDCNIKATKAATYDFEYHPFFIAESGIKNKMIIKVHA